MLTNEEAQYLIKVEKHLKEPHQVVDLSNKKNRIDLISSEDENQNFFMEITSNKKIILKTSIHHAESKNFIGLLRVDFRGKHKNPEHITSTLPEFIKPYAGKWFEIDEPHMHLYVEGYPTLAWAIPLHISNFPVVNIDEMSDLSNLINSFATKINISSSIKIQQAIF